ncbi:hypothetical protein EST38_g978 [Candolleomyces aberdarensis]|uniref:Uncharacterized protein n=1 Tax=Candolleomyces aberdarensis TaxID=2316362 RepID=A0A4Q2DX53_9AGAR|nr:hypothetical protein EST38_g978 [Candolleomyces aberdarensis]
MFKTKKHIKLQAKYLVEDDAEMADKDRVSMTALEIWKATGYRFTVRDNKKQPTGYRTRYWCCQDDRRKKKGKPSTAPNVKHREHVGMKRFPCQSYLAISSRCGKDGRTSVAIRLEHHEKHVQYLDVGMPTEVLDMIRDQMEWLKPATMVPKIQSVFPTVTATQIHTAWATLSQVYWRRDDMQLPSAKLLLEEFKDEVDVFDLGDIPEGAEMLAWGMKKIAKPLKGQVLELGIDATCKPALLILQA